MALNPGTKLGPYEVVAPAGAGGMGEVYRARDARLNRDVAVKVLPTEFSRDPDRLHRFQQEAQAVAALNHPNIMAIHDFGEHERSPYIVAELLEGETLRERLRGGALPTRKATDYAEQIARGLAAAHEKGIVHRDLKPENIFITRDGRVKILDFGLAKLARHEGIPATDAATLVSQTEPGVVMGTVGYMSPEQVRGQTADHRSDLFSFGAILYEMLSGRRAFRGETSVETMSAILKEYPPELTETNRSVPPALERIVRHCLEKNPEERFQSARDVAFNLQSLSGSTSQVAAIAPARQPAARVSRVAALAALSLAALAAVFWAGWTVRPTSSPSFKPLTFRRGTVTAARFAPDEQNVIYSAAWEGNPHPELFSTRIDGVASRPLEIGDADLLAISPQGEMALLQHWHRTFGWQRSGMLARLPLSGGASKEMLDGVEDADWARDGSRLAVIRSGSQYQLEFPLGHVLATVSSGWLNYPRISPDQKQIAFFEHPPGDDRGDVCLVDLDGHKRVLSGGWSSLAGLAWTPSGSELWFAGSNTGSSRSLYAVSLSGRVRPVLRVPGNLVLHDIAPDGRVLLSREEARRLIVGVTPGSSQERDLSWLDWSNGRDLTPDGRWLLLDEQGEGGGPKYSIYLRKTDGSPAVRLGDNDAFSISDDGKWVLATTNVEGGSMLLLPTGAGESRTIKTGNLRNPLGRFLPDGKRILVFDDVFRLYVQSLDGDTRRPVTPEGVQSWGVFTADGKYVLGWDAHKNWALYGIEGGQPIPLPKWTAGDVPINHTTDSDSFWVINGDIPVNVYRFDVLTGSRQFVRKLQPSDATGVERISDVLMTPDGRYYTYGGPRRLSNLFVVSGLK
ncbi:MAG: protein kinase [Terriglobales bacterium]|jgi:Tol biopolymer transport system component